MPIKVSVQKIRGFTYKLRNAGGGLVTILSFGYLGYILTSNWSQLISYEWRINWCQIALAFIYYSFSLILAVLGWGLIVSHFTQVKGLRKHLKYYTYTNLLRRLPIPLLYLLGRVYLYEREGIAKSVMVTVSFLEWILIVLSGIMIYLVTSPYLPLPRVWLSLRFLVVIFIASAFLLHPRTIRAIFRAILGQKGRTVLAEFGYSDALICLIIYGLVWIGGGMMLYATINSLYILSLAYLPAVIGAWVLSGVITTLVFATAAGLGVKELTLGLLLGYIIPSPLAIAIALLMRVCLIVFDILWGVVALKL